MNCTDFFSCILSLYLILVCVDKALSSDDEKDDGKIDWNDYSMINKENQRSGTGEQGRKVILQYSPEDLETANDLLAENRYSAYVSDQISVKRAIGDSRSEKCKSQRFMKNLPKNSVSVIIPFFNEHRSVLLRTVHSVITRSPEDLLKEVILVDDFSDKDELLDELDEYVEKYWTKVRIIRNTMRLGAIKSKVAGADSSHGDFLVFMDAHVEVNRNYLPPLIEPILLDYNTVASPTIDTIDKDTFEIIPAKILTRGVFSWDMIYQKLPLWDRDLKDESQPFPTPIIRGVAFAISKKWWEEIGKIHSSFRYSGADHLELSFKSWQCGGRVVEAPCARIAHLDRPSPYSSDVGKFVIFCNNLAHVATVWMDSYKDVVAKRLFTLGSFNLADLTDQMKIRDTLKCKSFNWYMKEVAPDILHTWPIEEPELRAWGLLKTKANSSLCLARPKIPREEFTADVTKVDTNELSLIVKKCDNLPKYYFDLNWRNQVMWFTEISENRFCLTNPNGKTIYGLKCAVNETTQEFAWNKDSGFLVSLKTGRCLEVDLTNETVFMSNCSKGRQTQSWSFDHMNEDEAVKAWENSQAKKLLKDEL